MEIKAYIRGAEVVASGIIHTSGNAPIDIVINGMPMQVRFFDDWINQTVRYDSRIDGAMWVLNLTNFSHSAGEGLFDPIPVTMVEGKQLSITFTIGTTNRAVGIRTFSYTFLHG